jgi:Protein of unknown function (DUF1559)
LLPAIQAAREAARRSKCQNNVKQLLTGIHLFLDTYKEFPAGIEPGYTGDTKTDFRHSWVPYVLPYIEEQAVYDQYRFDKPWGDALTNAALTRDPKTIQHFVLLICPSTQVEIRGRNDYAAIVGPGISGDPKVGWCPGQSYAAGVLISVPAPCPNAVDPSKYPRPNAKNSRIKVAQIEDGTGYTVLLGECSGRDVNVKPGENAGATLFWANGDHAFAHHHPILNDTPVDELYSDHPGGLQIGMADASVRFLTEETPKRIIDAIATRAGGEIFHGEL